MPFGGPIWPKHYKIKARYHMGAPTQCMYPLCRKRTCLIRSKTTTTEDRIRARAGVKKTWMFWHRDLMEYFCRVIRRVR
jgi:hypothetical protein